MIRARHTLIYVIVLAAIGGYYFYFEIVKPHQKQQAEQLAKKVFQLSIDQVSAIEILTRDKPPVRLAKETQWRINEPIQAEVDGTSLNALLYSLESLQRDQQLTEATSDNLKMFGLQEPALVLRFKTGETWRELFVGDLNPVGDAYYAKTGDGPAIFLMARGNWSIFNKQAHELRRRQLFVFDPPSVTALDVSWQGGEHFGVTKDGTGSWKSPDHADKVIKKSKVDHLLDQIHWLRALDFLADNAEDLKPWGLDPAFVTIKLQLKTNQEVTLQLSLEDSNKRRVAAVASQLPGVVQVVGDILQQVPKDLNSLEDRSLLAFRTEQVTQLIWKFGEQPGHLVYSDKTQWLWQLADGKRKELTQSGQIRALLWALDDAEYENRDAAASPPPPEAHGYLEFWGIQDKLGAICWEKPTTAVPPLSRIWLLPGDGANPLAFQVKPELIRKVEQALVELNNSQPK